jgi:hypothetical protein
MYNKIQKVQPQMKADLKMRDSLAFSHRELAEIPQPKERSMLEPDGSAFRSITREGQLALASFERAAIQCFSFNADPTRQWRNAKVHY